MFLIISIITGFAACKKGGNTPPATPKDYADFLKNSEWVGVLDRNGYEYPPPCGMTFNIDNTITMHALFYLKTGPNEWTYKDSISGKINSMDSMADGRTRINVNFSYINDQTIYITNREKIMCVPSGPNPAIVTFQGDIFPFKGFSVKGTQWRGPLMPGAQPTSGYYAYPDLSTIIFLPDKNITMYSKNGQPVLWGGIVGADPGVQLQSVYVQRGAMVYMAGYNDEKATKDIGYIGVLLPSGDKMMVDSRAMDARLPNYIQTSAPYGPIGATPIIYKQ